MEQILNRLKEMHDSGKDLQVLDIGGWFNPCKQAQHMVDIMPFETMNTKGAYGFGEMKIKKENYHVMDISSLDKLPFSDKQFDYVICRHTLEDIMNPLKVCEEMIRVGKAGYIETPSRLYESTKGVERPDWCGHYHHRWLVETGPNSITFQFKPHNIHFRRAFYFRRFPWQKFKSPYDNTFLEWKDSFVFSEKILIDNDDVKNDLRAFKEKNKNLDFLKFRWN